MSEFVGLAQWIMLAALVGGLAYSVGRLLDAVAASRQRVSLLKSQQVAEAKRLLKEVTEIDRLENEIKEGRGNIETAVQKLAARRQELANFVSPEPPEILVTSEYPSARLSRCWIADMRTRDAAGGRRGETASARSLLIWAVDYATAMNLASRAIGRTDLEVAGIRLLD